MGARGPKRGHKTLAAAAAQQAAAVSAAPAPQAPEPKKRAPRVAKALEPAVATTIEQANQLSSVHRENPSKLGGEALRRLGSQRGLSRSEMARMSDEKIRRQLDILTHRQYETESA